MPEALYSFDVPIVVVIIEGASDKRYLKEPLEAYYRKKHGHTCKIVTVRDVTGDPNVNDNTFVSEMVTRIELGLSDRENMIDNDVAVMITEVVHVFDIDEAFVDDDLIVENENCDNFTYSRKGISYKSKQAVISRNKTKRGRIETLLKMKEITLFGKTFPYQVFFYSVNIDDFHHDDALNWDADTKNKRAAEFERQYFIERSQEGKIKKFLQIFKNNNPEDFPETFEETWDYIKVDNHSLNKCSNVFLIIKK